MSIKAVAIVLLLLAAGQALFMLIAPERFAALELWKYRVIGARPAEPGPGTFLFYRFLGGLAFACAALILIYQFVPE